MNHSVYPIRRVGKKLVFVFRSVNQEGANPVTKIVGYPRIVRGGHRYYNLEFGDLKRKSVDFDDMIVTDNGDMRKVLRTVAATLETFFDELPNAKVHIYGSDSVRHAYYHKLIRDYYRFIKTSYNVFGHINNRIGRFQPNIEYDFIIVAKREF